MERENRRACLARGRHSSNGLRRSALSSPTLATTPGASASAPAAAIPTMPPDGSCPVTHPASSEAVPQAVIDAIAAGASVPLKRADFQSWYGNDALWVELYPQGPRRSEKFPWVRLGRGSLTITAHRIDGEAAPAVAHVPQGYGDTGFQASGIDFPTAGCWELTGQLAGEPLRFVVKVLDTSP